MASSHFDKVASAIDTYCAETIPNYRARLRLAFSNMDEQRAPLQVVDFDLYDAITAAINDYCEDHDECAEAFCPEDIIWS